MYSEKNYRTATFPSTLTILELNPGSAVTKKIAWTRPLFILVVVVWGARFLGTSVSKGLLASPPNDK
jgi:hypothetical protein